MLHLKINNVSEDGRAYAVDLNGVPWLIYCKAR